MSWIDVMSARLASGLGFNGVRNLYSVSVLKYLEKYESDINTDPYLLSSVHLSTLGFFVFESKYFRENLVDTLNDDEIIILSRKLNMDSPVIDNARQEIVNIQWEWSSEKVRTFCDYFNCSDVIDDALRHQETDVSDERIISSISGSSKIFYELHPYQSQVRADVIKHFTIGNQQKALIQLPTGAGKTRVAIHTVVKYLNDHAADRKNVIWLAYQPLLLKQAIETFEKVWPIIGREEIAVGQYYGGINTEYVNSECSILFANVGVLLNKYKNDLKKKLDKNTCLIVFDEAHQSVADNARRLLSNLLRNENIKLIGLTATPGRSADDELENQKLVQFYDGYRFELSVPEDDFFMGASTDYLDVTSRKNTSIAFLQKEGVLANLKHELLKMDKVDEIPHGGDVDVYNGTILKDLAASPERNRLIVNKAVELNSDKMKTLIFACSVEHARDLVALLKFRNVNAGLVIGDNTGEREILINKFMHTEDLNILINYGVLTMGFDAPNVNALIIARPTSSVVTYSQILGRGLRGPMNGGHDVNYVYNVDTPFYGDEIDAYKHFENYWS